jgi:hypothetical protein
MPHAGQRTTDNGQRTMPDAGCRLRFCWKERKGKGPAPSCWKSAVLVVVRLVSW